MRDAMTDLREDQLGRWQRGDSRPVEDYFAEHELDVDAALDLIYSEVLLREEFGERPRAEEYALRFPQFADAIGRQFAFHDAVADLSDPAADTPTDSVPTIRPSPGERAAPRLIGNYEVLDEIGSGGAGVVYRARHRLLSQRVVALKVLRAEFTAAPDAVAALHREADAVARLRHENIVPVHDFGTWRSADTGEEAPWIAFEHVEGGTLANRINGTPLPPRDAAALLGPLARAVAHAHRQGVIHRDLKPSNVLLSTQYEGLGTPMITDFGLARRIDGDASHSGSVRGTPSYMAPEQASGRAAGPAADVYGLGALLYEMLTGRPPFRAATVLHTLQQVVAAEPVAPRDLNPTTPRDLETICLKCLNKQPERRYASADELADDVRRFLDGEPIRARPASALERAVKWTRRYPARAALIGVSVVAAVVLAAVWVGFTLRLRQETDFAVSQQRRAEEERDEARRQTERAANILRLALTSVDEITKATRAAGETEADTGALFFKLACSYARTSAALARDRELPLQDRADLSDQYASNAMRLLECAARVGFFRPDRPKNRRELEQSEDLVSLRDHPRFRKFLATLPPTIP